jgi:pilus assembly protein CpaB
MRGRTVVMLLIAALIASGTAYLVRSALTQHPVVAETKPLPPPRPQTKVLVANAAIARGQILKPVDFAWRPWSDGAVAADFIVSGAEPEKSFAGWVAREPFVAGEPIVKTKIVAPGERGFLAAVLGPGMRAMSIAVDQTSDVSGFIFPGDRVDVLITMALPAEDSNNNNNYTHKAAETVLRDIRVIGIDQRLDSKDGQVAVARTVTLEVTPKQSEIVALAVDMQGKISLSLRALRAPREDASAVIAAAGSGPLSRVAAAGGGAIDGHDGVSFTLDSEVSPLLGKPSVKHNPDDGKLTILRGNGNSVTTGGSQPGS